MPSPHVGDARMKLQRRRRFVTAPPFFRRRLPQHGIALIVKITRTAEKITHTVLLGRRCVFAAHNPLAAI